MNKAPRHDDGGPQWPWRAQFEMWWARSALRGLGWCELPGTVRWPDGGSVADGRRQAGSGRARNRAKARLNWFCQGQPWGRCRVRRRALRAMRPAREEEASSEGLGGCHRFAQTDAHCPACQVVGHDLYGPARRRWRGSVPRGRWLSPTPYFRSRMAFSISAWRRWLASRSRVSPSLSVTKA